MKQKLTNEDRAQIISRYAAGESTVTLSKEFGIDSSYVTRIARSAGISRRLSSAAPSKLMTCPSCKKQVPQNSRFCMFCGGDVRTGKMRATEAIEELRGLVACLPAHLQSEADRLTRIALQFLKGV